MACWPSGRIEGQIASDEEGYGGLNWQCSMKNLPVPMD